MMFFLQIGLFWGKSNGYNVLGFLKSYVDQSILLFPKKFANQKIWSAFITRYFKKIVRNTDHIENPDKTAA